MSALSTERRTRLIEMLADRGLDSLLVFGNAWQGDYLRYATDFASCEGDALSLIEADGRIALYVETESEAERAATECEELDVVTDPDLVRIVTRALERLPARSRVGFAPASLIPAGLVGPLQTMNAVDATSAVDELLIHKSALEQECIAKAAALADWGYDAFRRIAQVGCTEYELVAKVEEVLRRSGAPDNFMLVGSGGVEVRGMHPPGERRLQAGDLVTTELTPCVNGYYAQLCRTLVVGEPSDAQRSAFEVFRGAVYAGRAMVRPGVTASQVAKAQNDVFRSRGLGEYCTSEYTRVRGHGLGLFPDSKPHVLEGVNTVLPEGAALIVHPNTYHPAVGYIVLGDTLLVTEDGYRNLCGTPLELLSNLPN